MAPSVSTNNKLIGSRSTFSIFICASVLALAMIALLWLTIGEWERQRVTQDSYAALTSVQDKIRSDQFRPVQWVLEKVIAFPEIVNSLRGEDNQRDTEVLLNGIATGLNAKLVYVMTPEGTVVASSRNSKGVSLFGKNYRFREYFVGALEGKKVVFGAVGVTTGERGLYLSTPITDQDSSEIIGVGVIKIGISSIENALEQGRHPLALVTPSGVIFISNRDKLLYKTIQVLDQHSLQNLHASRQFANAYIEQISGPIDCGDGLYEKDERVEVSADLEIPGWKIVAWQGLQFPMTTAISLSFFIAALVGGSSLIIVARKERLRVIEKIKQANDDLQLEIEERKKTEKALTIARRQSEVANSAKSQFLANMSHEIRTPMNAVMGLTHLLMQTGLTQQQADYLNKISLSADNLLTIIDDILDLSKN